MVQTWSQRVSRFTETCFSNQMTIIRAILTFLCRKHLRFYNDQYHALYTLQPCIITCTEYFLQRTLFIISSDSAAQRGLWPPRPRGFLITHNDVLQSVGFLCMSYQLVSDTST
jgi:hypothetical protein